MKYTPTPTRSSMYETKTARSRAESMAGVVSPGGSRGVRGTSSARIRGRPARRQQDSSLDRGAQLVAAVHEEGGAGDVVGVVGGEEDRRPADVLGGAQAAPGEGRSGPADGLGAEGLVFAGGVDPAWFDDVD